MAKAYTIRDRLELDELLDKLVLVGLNYFDTEGCVQRQNQISGKVIQVCAAQGIKIRLQNGNVDIPADLSAWHKAPRGHYKLEQSNSVVVDPDYLVTWNVFPAVNFKNDYPNGVNEQWLPTKKAPDVLKSYRY